MTPHKQRFRVSAIIPVYNGERYLAEAIGSVLEQTYPIDEIIVVDDGSTDGSASVARNFKDVRLALQAQSGAATARNRGVELATGDVIAFLDADDVWMPNKNKLQVTALEQHPEVDMVFGYVEQFISPDVEDVVRRQVRCPEEKMVGYIPGAGLVRREVFDRVGLFLPQWKIGDFIDWYARAMESSITSILLPEVVMRRRLHGTNLGVRERASQVDYVRIARAALERRRKQ